MACAADSDVTNTSGSESGSGDGSSTASETESGSPPSDASESESESEGESESETDDETDSGWDPETESDTGVDPAAFDPQCGDWTSTLVQVDRLNEVRVDGDEIMATGGSVLVQRDDNDVWSDYIEFSPDMKIFAYDEIWGPPDDRWVAARKGLEATIYHFDGASLTPHATFPDANDPQASEMIPRELVGRGPDDIWALAAPDCVCFFPPCTCFDISALLHWDGQSWSSVPTPGQLLDIALTQTGVWGVGTAGLVARYDGQDWDVDDFGGGTFDRVWALDDDEIWVAGWDYELLHRSGGVWTSTELPEPNQRIIALEGRAQNQVWALDEYDGVWAFDGVAWSELAELPGAEGLAIVGEGESLMVVGGAGWHVVWEVDTADGSSTLLHARPNIEVRTMIADDVDHMLLSTGASSGSWSVTNGVWQPEFELLNRDFTALLGPIDEAIGVRNNDHYPDAVWQLGKNPIAPLPDPDLEGQFNDVIELEGRLWVAGRREYWEDEPFVHAYDGTSWTDHSPPLIAGNDDVKRLTAAGGRLFAQLRAYEIDRIMYLDDLDGDNWVSLPAPAQDDQISYADIAATASDQLWVTRYASGEKQLLMWDGAQWHDAATLYPQLGEQCCWHRFEQGHGRLWMISSGNDQSEQLAYFDGMDWTIVETPPQLHGWSWTPEIAVAVDGLFIYDGIHIWRYAFCPA
jgi:hypothetical protein